MKHADIEICRRYLMNKTLNRNRDGIRKLNNPVNRLILLTKLVSPIRNKDPKIAIRILIKRIRRFSRFYRFRVLVFKTGRTANPETRRNQIIEGKKPDAWIELYISDNIEHVFEVEKALNEYFYQNPKSANKSPSAGGGIAPSKDNCVYLAVIKE